MTTADDAIDFFKAHTRNLLLTLDGHAALQQIIAEASRLAAEAKKEAGGPG